jgi:hypothetical protein
MTTYTTVTKRDLASELLEGWCESGVDSQELERSVRVHTIGPSSSHPAIELKHLTSLPSTQLFPILS